MALQVGLVGLPNVGKSTLFNAVSKAGALAANFPFATIEPNVGTVPVPDDRLSRLAALSASERTVPTAIEFVDIAGLVAGASTGEGLGNKFLSHIREVDAVCHVVRAFEDPDVVHVAASVDPLRDIEVIDTELILKDLDTVATRAQRLGRSAKSGDRDAIADAALAVRLEAHLSDGQPARTFDFEARTDLRRELALLTDKPVLYAANVGEDELPDGGPLVEPIRALADEQGAEVVVICAQVEAELAELAADERAEYLATLGLDRPGLERLIEAAYRLLRLETYFTTGPAETRAWTIRTGTRAPQAAGRIHTDMERGFIRAEVISFEDFDRLESEAAARDAGRLRSEGKEYVVSDGDVVHFRFNV